MTSQSGDGTASAALAWLSGPLAHQAGVGPVEEPATGGPQSGDTLKGEEEVLVVKERVVEGGNTKAKWRRVGAITAWPTQWIVIEIRVVPIPITLSKIPQILPKLQYRVSARTQVYALIRCHRITHLLHRQEHHKHYDVMLHPLTSEVESRNGEHVISLCLSYQVGKTWMHGRLTTRIQMDSDSRQ